MSAPCIYIAGAMAELDRAVMAIAAVRAAYGADCITFDWTVEVAAAIAEGIPDTDLDAADRKNIARTNFEAIADADLFWLLASTKGVDSWVELGIAIAIADSRRWGSSGADGPHVIVSGAEAVRSLNSELADCISATDHDALAHIVGLYA